METGPKTTTQTSTTFLNCKGMAWSDCMKLAIAKFTMKVIENTEIKLLIAVNVTFRATSPFAIWEYRLAVGPPGDAESNMRPTANSGESPKPEAMK